MASVWYIGYADVREISSTEWTRVGKPGSTTRWDKTNGWSVSQSALTSDQIAFLDDINEFVVTSANGPRPGSVVTPTANRGLTLADATELVDRIGAMERSRPLASVLGALAGGQSAAVIVQGDSTGNDSTEWVYLASQRLAAAADDAHVLYQLWDDAAQSYGAWEVLQAGALGERHAVFTASSRTFYCVPENVTAVTGDIDVRVRVACDDWTPAAAQCLVGRFGSAGSRSWRMEVNTAGRMTFGWTADGTTEITVTGTNPLGFTDGTTRWLRATLDVDNGSGGYTCTLYSSTDGLTWTQQVQTVTTGGTSSIFNPTAQDYEIGGRGLTGAILQGKIYEVQIREGIAGRIVNPQGIDAWVPRIISSSFVAGTFGGSPTLYISNGSRAGANLAHLADTTRFPKMVRPFPGAVVMLSCSHNDTGLVGAQYATDRDEWLALAKARVPAGQFVFITQNPQTSPIEAPLIHGHATRRRDLLAWAPRNACAVVDVYRAFLEDSRGLGALVSSDGLHPTAAGSQLWDDAVKHVLG